MKIIKFFKNPKEAYKRYAKRKSVTDAKKEGIQRIDSILFLLTNELSLKQSTELFQTIKEDYDTIVLSKVSDMKIQLKAANNFLLDE